MKRPRPIGGDTEHIAHPRPRPIGGATEHIAHLRPGPLGTGEHIARPSSVPHVAAQYACRGPWHDLLRPSTWATMQSLLDSISEVPITDIDFHRRIHSQESMVQQSTTRSLTGYLESIARFIAALLRIRHNAATREAEADGATEHADSIGCLLYTSDAADE